MFLSLVAVQFFVLLGLLGSLLYLLRATSSRPKHHRNGRKLPPGPRGLPIIGNLHMLGTLPHQTLHHLAKKYGPIMSMNLGHVPAIVVSSPEAAELFLRTHDTVFASRPKIQASLYMSYGYKSMGFGQYGPYWRNLRKICTVHLLSASRVEAFAPTRNEELGLLVGSLKKAAAVREVVDFGESVGGLVENITCRMIFGQANPDGMNFKSLVKEYLNLEGAFNIADYVPYIGALDLQGFTRRMKAFAKEMDKALERIIDDHERDARTKRKEHEDFVDVLLSLMNKPMNPGDETVYVFDRANIKALLVDMIGAAFDTSATTIEWIFSELLRHPRVMKCLQEELDSVVGRNRMVEEADLPTLEYLDMLIKESMRLHPIAPLLVPRESMKDITIDGFHIPKKSRIFVNAYAIGRDPAAWSDNAQEFLPERFKDTNVDLRGRDFQLIPFGSGRRGCPGMQLGLTMVRLIVAQLAHCFSWELHDGMLPSDLDMTETFGLAVERATRLLAVPTYRLSF